MKQIIAILTLAFVVSCATPKHYYMDMEDQRISVGSKHLQSYHVGEKAADIKSKQIQKY